MSGATGQPAALRLAAALLGAFLILLVPFAGRAEGDASDYPSPLYLSGAASSLVTSSFQLVAGPPSATPATPTAATSGAVGSGVLSGSYAYLSTVDGGAGAFTASATSISVAPSTQAVLVGDLPTVPTGVTVDIYRQKSGTGLFYRVAHLVANSSSTYTDNLSDAAAAANPALPQADNRIATLFSSTCAATTCGYIDFSPGVAPATTAATTPPTLAASPSATPNNKGWIVEGAGSVTFPAGTWTFQVRTKNSNPNGVAHLVVGVWKVTTSGGVISGSTAILDPTCTGAGTPAAGCPGSAENGTNIVTAAATVQTIAHSVSLPSISLAAGEHLYVQFWRRQTTPYSTGGTANRLATMMAYDTLAQISHPAFPNDPTLQTPADGARTNSSMLTATFSDPEAGDTGTVGFRVCSAAAAAGSQCSGLLASGSSASVANGASASWTISPALADGTHYWQAQATDAAGNQSSWTATRSFTLDTTPPDTTITAGPADPSATSAPSFSFSATEAGSSFQCQLDGGGYGACTSPKSSAGLADGSHTFQVKATDPAGNTDASPASSTWTVDTIPPAWPELTRPGDGARTNSLRLAARFPLRLAAMFSDPNPRDTGTVTFRVCADPECATVLATGSSSLIGNGATASWTIDAALGEGTYYWQARAQDVAGNRSGWTAIRSFTLDTTPPDPPASFSGTVRAAVLTLYWTPPAAEDSVGNYLLYVDGVRSAILTGATLQARLEKFDADDPRSFAVAAIDAAGNEGPRSETLVGVPDLVGLRISEARAALAARALVFGKQAKGIAQGSESGLITSQQPAAATLAPKQRAVFVALSSPSGRTGGGAGVASSAPLVVRVAGSRTVSCAPSGRLSLQIMLTGRAQVTVRFLTLQGVPLDSRQLGSVQAGTKTVRVRIPSSLRTRGRYRLIVTAMTQSQIGRAELRLDLSKGRVSLGARSPGCRAASLT